MSSSSEQDLSARNQAILNTAVDAIVTIDERGVIESVNHATEQMFGYKPDELVGRNVKVLMPEPFRSEHDGYMQAYLDTGETKIIGVGREVTGLKKDGATFPVHLAVSEFVANGTRMFTGIIRDISHLKRTQEQLVQSARLAAIGQMVTGLAHESRNALQRAQAFLDMLALDLAEVPEQLDLTRRTQKALKDLYRLYEEVRNYAAPIQLEYRPCDVIAVCEKVWSYLEESHAAKNIELVTQGAAAAKPRVDVHRLEQIVRNILENAIDACPENARITINCEPCEQNAAPAVLVSFHDTGPGLTADSRERLFEPFYTTKQKGTGLGMAICQRLVEAHGGTISADPIGGVGTRIVVVLPLDPQEVPGTGS